MPLKAARASLLLLCLLLPLSIAGANYSWGLVLIALLWHWAAGGRLPLKAAWGELSFPLCLFIGTAVLADLLGTDPRHSLRFLHQDLHKLWLYALLSLALAVARPAKPEAALGAGFAAAALVGIVQWFGPMRPDGVPARAHAFVHPVVFGEQMAVACLGACAFLLAGARGWTRKTAWGLLILCGTALVLSDTRAAVAAAALGAAAAAWAAKVRRKTMIRIGLPIAAAGLAVTVWGLSRGTYPVTLKEEVRLWRSGGELPAHNRIFRLVFWDAAWRMGKDHPLTGVGVNNYRKEFRRYYSGPLEGGALDWGSAHNLFLHQFAERGLIGLAALFYLLGTLWRGAWRRVRASPDPWNLWALGVSTAFLAMNLTETALENEIFWMLVFWVHLLSERRPPAPRT